MEAWFNETVDLIRRSLPDLSSVNYKSLLFVFYDHMSNRNLAKLIAYLYEKDSILVYFEIDRIIAREDYDPEEVSGIIEKLNQNGFQDWIKEDI